MGLCQENSACSFRKIRSKLRSSILFLALCSVGFFAHAADDREAVRSMYVSLTGAVPTKAKLDSLTSYLKDNKALATAKKIVNENNDFYDVTLKNFYSRWTNVRGSSMEPLNDMTALLVGVTRDDIPFNRAFSGDYYYLFAGPLVGTKGDQISVFREGTSGPTETLRAYFTNPTLKDGATMDQFEEAELKGISLDQLKREEGNQAARLQISNDGVAGLFSTRAFASAYYSAGTNRRATAFALKNFMCKTMEQLNDVSIPDSYVRKDVDRTPGGNTRTYETSCMGCHAGMDALSGAFVYYDFNGKKIIYSRPDSPDDITPEELAKSDAAAVVPKINRNIFTPRGFAPSNNFFINLWTAGQNAKLGWRGKTNGFGAADFGQMITESIGFHGCMVEQVFESVCGREATSLPEKVFSATLARNFGDNPTHASYFNMKEVFLETAAFCGGAP